MSKQRAKGTRWESELLGLLRVVWPHAERAPLKGVHDHGDFLNVGQWLLEAKAVDVPRFLDWARKCREKSSSTGARWAVLWKGNRRTPDGQPLVLLDLVTFLRLVQLDADADGITPTLPVDLNVPREVVGL